MVAWPRSRHIENLAKSCQACCAVKHAPPVVPLNPWLWRSKPWQCVHLADFAGPFLGSMLFVAVDAHSKWPEVKVMSTMTVPAMLNVLKELFSAHGVTEQLVMDNGTQFTSDAFKVFTQSNGIRHLKCPLLSCVSKLQSTIDAH